MNQTFADSKAPYNPKKCLKCKYHGEHLSCGNFVRVKKPTNGKAGKSVTVYCNYADITGNTCLKALNPRESYDTRGDDYNNCLLFEKGKRVRKEPKGIELVEV